MLRFVLALLLILVAALPAQAMKFSIIDSDGQKFVFAKGEIKKGDPEKLARAFEGATRDRNGTKGLILNSSGGIVVYALQMADVMAEVGVTTIIPAKAQCLSACASVLFVAGKYRRIEAGGLLGIHSCYDTRNGKNIDECDAVLAERAEAHGISGRAMMAFQQMTSQDSIVMFTAADAACFGLTRQPGRPELGDRAPCIVKILKQATK